MMKTLSEKLESLDLTISKLNAECEDAANNRSDDIDLPVEIETAKAQAQHYVESTKEFKKLLSASGIKKEYTHEHLQKMSDKVSALSADIEQTKKRIADFKELPPSIPLALEKIRLIKIEIATVEQEFPELACVS
ncbi:uncharacterized protein LOC134811225 [Bolinopsis microptera]|uniref:uncharacterized protein LOC134811225 n=1 Tax=Bolinopsis microptera TaxID=2820187 RepID=UPI00307A9D0E